MNLRALFRVARPKLSAEQRQTMAILRREWTARKSDLPPDALAMLDQLEADPRTMDAAGWTALGHYAALLADMGSIVTGTDGRTNEQRWSRLAEVAPEIAAMRADSETDSPPPFRPAHELDGKPIKIF